MPELALEGAFTALVTPFSEDGERIDFAAFERLLERQLRGKICGLVPCGTTGEAPTLSATEQQEVIARTRAVAGERVPILAGVGSNNTKATIASAQAALDAGADSLMVVMPYYSKPSQEGLVEHVTAVAKAVSAPLVLYNIPGRTSVTLSVESSLRILEACPNVVGVKDATGGLDYSQELLRRAGDRVALMSGDDALTLPMLAAGARGVISVASNLYPTEVNQVVDAAASNDWAVARSRHFRLLPVYRGLFSEPSPGPIKAALSLKQLLHDSLRLPMTPVSDHCRATLRRVIEEFEAQ